MKIYLAASWSLKDRMQGARDLLHRAGHEVTSRWIDDPAEQSLKAPDLVHDAGTGAAHARHNLEDIDAADCVLVFTEADSTSGGLHVELGYAYAMDKRVIICGPRVNVFQCLFPQFATFTEVLGHLDPP